MGSGDCMKIKIHFILIEQTFKKNNEPWNEPCIYNGTFVLTNEIKVCMWHSQETKTTGDLWTTIQPITKI